MAVARSISCRRHAFSLLPQEIYRIVFERPCFVQSRRRMFNSDAPTFSAQTQLLHHPSSFIPYPWSPPTRHSPTVRLIDPPDSTTAKQIENAVGMFGHIVKVRQDGAGRWVVRFASFQSASDVLRTPIFVHGNPIRMESVKEKQEELDVLSSVFVAGLSSWVSLHDLHHVFSDFGTVHSILRHNNRSDVAIVVFQSDQWSNVASNVVAHTNKFPLAIQGRSVRVELSAHRITWADIEQGPIAPWRLASTAPASRPSPFHPLPLRTATRLYHQLRRRLRTLSGPLRKLHVTNLPNIPHLEQELIRYFNAVGPAVDMHVDLAHPSPARRYVHIEYPSADTAVCAVARMLADPFPFGDTPLKVNFAQGTRDPMRTRTIFINNWPANASIADTRTGSPLVSERFGPAELRAIFQDQTGLQAVLLLPPYPPALHAPAFVTFDSVHNASRALEAVNGTSIPALDAAAPRIPLQMTVSELPFLPLDDLRGLLRGRLAGDLGAFGSWDEITAKRWRNAPPGWAQTDGIDDDNNNDEGTSDDVHAGVDRATEEFERQFRIWTADAVRVRDLWPDNVDRRVNGR